MHVDVERSVGMRRRVSFLVALTFAATLVRYWVALRGGMWRDEALFLAIVRLPSWNSVLEFLRNSESHPPLFYAMMRAWLRITGDNDASALALVAILGGLLVPVMYWIGVRLYSRRVAMWVAVVAAFSPSLIAHSAAVRPYSLLPLLVVVSSYQLIRALHSGIRKAWIIYILVSAAMLYTHNWTWLVGFGQFVAVAAWGARDITRRRRRLAEAGFAAAAVFALYVPWLSTLLHQTSMAGHAPVSVESVTQAVVIFGAFVVFALQATILASVGDPSAIWFGLTVILSVIAAWLAYSGALHGRMPAEAELPDDKASLTRLASRVFVVTSLAAFGLAVLLSTRTLLVFPWCIAMLAPGVLLATIAWVMRIWDMAKSRQHRALVAGVGMMIVGSYGAGIGHLLSTERSNALEVAQAVGAKANASDLIVIAPQWIAPSFNSYYRGANQQIDYPTQARELTVSFSGLASRMASPEIFARTIKTITEARRANRRVWLISESFNIAPLSAADERRLMNNPARVGNVRVNQLRSSLVSLYGSPVERVDVKNNPVRLEEVVALLFSPLADSATSH